MVKNEKESRSQLDDIIKDYLALMGSCEQISGARENYQLLKKVRGGTFPENPLILKKVSSVKVERNSRREIEIYGSKKEVLIPLGEFVDEIRDRGMLRKYSKNNERMSITLASDYEIDFEVANIVSGPIRVRVDKNVPQKLYLKYRTPNAVQAKNKLIKGNLGLVVTIATGYNLEKYLEDMIGSGNIGLIRAVDKFDLKSLIKFSNYAAHWINSEIKKCLMNIALPIRLQQDAYQRRGYIDKINHEMIESNQIIPTDEELYEKIKELENQGQGFGPNRRITMGNIKNLRGLAPVNTGHSNIQEKECHSLYPSAYDKVLEDEVVYDLLQRLGSRKIGILMMKYGLGDYDEHTNKEIAEKYNVSGETIRNLKGRALKKLRQMVG